MLILNKALEMIHEEFSSWIIDKCTTYKCVQIEKSKEKNGPTFHSNVHYFSVYILLYQII